MESAICEPLCNAELVICPRACEASNKGQTLKDMCIMIRHALEIPRAAYFASHSRKLLTENGLAVEEFEGPI